MSLILITGLPGTGKSFFAQRLQKELNSHPILLSTDIIRKRIFKVAEHKYMPFGEDLYSEKNRNFIYDILYAFVEILIHQKHSVIVDGTFYSAQLREPLISLCKHFDTQLVIIETVCKEEIVKNRINNRLDQDLETSDANFEIYIELKKRFEPITQKHLIVNTGKDIEINIREVMSYIEHFQP